MWTWSFGGEDSLGSIYFFGYFQSYGLTNEKESAILIAMKKETTIHEAPLLSGRLQDDLFGDKETAVRIRDNSHYRI